MIVLPCSALAAFAFALEWLVEDSRLGLGTLGQSLPLTIRAAIDNAAHAAIAAATWTSASLIGRPVMSFRRVLTEALVAAIVGSAVDLDHFVAAQSLSLRAATKLRHRPFAHSALAVLAIPTTLGCTGAITWPFAILVATSIASHQARDGLRRGIWFASTWSTPPLSRLAYAVALIVLALLAAALRSRGGASPFANAAWLAVRPSCWRRRECVDSCREDNERGWGECPHHRRRLTTFVV